MVVSPREEVEADAVAYEEVECGDWGEGAKAGEELWLGRREGGDSMREGVFEAAADVLG